MMFAIFDHLSMVDSRQLSIPLTSDFSIEKQCGLDQIGACFGDAQPFRFSASTLLTGGNNAAPKAELLDGREASDILNESHIGGGALQTNAANRPQKAVCVEVPIIAVE